MKITPIVSSDLIHSVRLAAANFSPAIKRLFYWSPGLYVTISLVPLVAAIRAETFSKKRAIIAVLLILWVALRVAPEKAFLSYLPMFFVWTFSRYTSCVLVENSFWKLRFFFVVSVLYALVQKKFGYLPHELGWIYSGLGAVRAEGFFVTDDIRPFSIYAGVPDFAFFSAIVLYFAIEKRSYFFVGLGLLGLYLAASRGIIVSAVIALATAWLSRLYTPRRATIVGCIIALIAYLFLAVVLPLTGFLEAKDDASRMLVYGTFNYRITMLKDFWEQLDLFNIWYGVGSGKMIFDNFYLTLLNDFGLLGLAIFLISIIRAVSTKSGIFFSTLVLSYCLYADALFSVYFSYNAFVLMGALQPSHHDFEGFGPSIVTMRNNIRRHSRWCWWRFS